MSGSTGADQHMEPSLPESSGDSSSTPTEEEDVIVVSGARKSVPVVLPKPAYMK